MAQTRAPMKNRQKSRSGCRNCKQRRVGDLSTNSLRPFPIMPYRSEVVDDGDDRRRAECTDSRGYSYDATRENQDARTVSLSKSYVLAISSVCSGRPSTKLLFQHSQPSQKTLNSLSLPHPRPLSHPKKINRQVVPVMPGLLPKHLFLRHRLHTIMQRHHRPHYHS